MPLVTHVTINGTTVRAARTLEVNRILQSSQYAPCPQPFHLTKPASKNEERKGPMKTTQRQKKPTLLRRFSLTGPPMRYRMRRSEERRVGKECRARWEADSGKKKKKRIEK